MKKETIIAIFFGVIFGGLVAVFLLTKNKELQLNKTETLAPTIAVNKTSKSVPLNIKTLEIIEPKDGSVFDAKNITIKGKADKDSLIIIQSPSKDTVLRTDKEDFSVSFPLALGENVIKITAYLKDAKIRPQERELRVYNLDDKL